MPRPQGATVTGGLVAALSALVACGGESGTPEALRFGRLGPPLRVWPVSVGPEAPPIGRWVPGIGAFVSTSTAVALWTETERVPFSGAAGSLRAALRYERAALVGTSRGLFILSGRFLDPSPIQAALGPGGVTDLAVTGAAVWAAHERGLFRWEDGTAVQLRLEGDGVASARLATDGFDLVAWTEDRLWRIDGRGRSAVRLAGPQRPIEAAMTSDGRVWVVDEAGTAWSAPPEGRLEPIEGLQGVRSVRAAGATAWLDGALGLYRALDGELQPLEGVSGRLLDAAGEGASLVEGSGALVRLHDRLSIELVNLPEGPVDTALDVEVRPLFGDDVATVEVELDSEPLPVSSRPWRFVLDPARYPTGPRRLWVRVSYRDDKPDAELARTVALLGGVPTWSNAIEPLYRSRCALCHGSAASARDLDSRAKWEQDFDVILDNVRAGRMPLPPAELLGTREIRLLEGWAAAGFPE